MAKSRNETKDPKTQTTPESTAPQEPPKVTQEGTAHQEPPQATPEGTAPQGGGQTTPESTAPQGDGQITTACGAPETTYLDPGSTVTERVVVAYPDGLNFRIGPATSFASLATLDNGTVLKLHTLPGGAEVPGWALAETPDGKFGWVHAGFIQAVPEDGTGTGQE